MSVCQLRDTPGPTQSTLGQSDLAITLLSRVEAQEKENQVIRRAGVSPGL